MVSIYQQRQIAKRAQAQIWHFLKMKSLVQQTSDNSTKPLLGLQQAPMLFKEFPNAYHFARKTTSFVAQTSDSSIKPSAGTVLGFQQSPRILRDLSKADQRWGSDETPIELDLTDGWWEKLIELAGEIVPVSWKDQLKFWLDSRFGKRVKFQVVNGKDWCEVYLNIGGFGVDDIHVHLEGKYIYVTGKSENLGFELNVKKTYRIKRNMKFDPEKVTGYMQRGMLKIHLPSSPTSVKKSGIFKVYLKDLDKELYREKNLQIDDAASTKDGDCQEKNLQIDDAASTKDGDCQEKNLQIDDAASTKDGDCQEGKPGDDTDVA